MDVLLINENRLNIIYGGDYNIDMAVENYLPRGRNKSICTNGYANLIEIPTRVTASMQTIINLFVRNFRFPDVRSRSFS